MKQMIERFFQPLQQSKKRIAANLLLAPIGGLFLVFTGLLFAATFNWLMTDINLSLGLFMLIIPAFLFYSCFIYIPLLIYFLVLQHFHKFHLFSIALAAIFGFFSFHCLSQPNDFLAAFNLLMLLLFFILPTASFFIFLSLRSHKRIMLANLSLHADNKIQR